MNIPFKWDEEKNIKNIQKHGVDFKIAQYTFLDSNRVIARDLKHSEGEKRYYVFGKVKGDILTVRFTYRDTRIRIIGAGYSRKGKNIYEKQNKI